MKPQIERIKEYTDKITLTDTEKLAMLQNLRTHMDIHPVKNSYSLYLKYTLVYASMFMVIIGTTATSIAAEGSLPGDLLYPFKTNINEGVVKTFAFSDVKKAKVNVTLVDRRMEELEEMIVEQKDSPEKIDIIIEKLEEHKEEIEEFARQEDSLFEDGSEVSEETTEIYATLESVIDTHLDVIKSITDNTELSTNQNEDTTTSLAAKDIEEKTGEETFLTLTKDSSEQDEVKEETPASEDMAKEISDKDRPVDHVIDFDTKIKPVFDSIQKKSNLENKEVTDKIKKEVRRKIIETAEEEFRIDIKEEDDVNININII
jgi:hypothetical protein